MKSISLTQAKYQAKLKLLNARIRYLQTDLAETQKLYRMSIFLLEKHYRFAQDIMWRIREIDEKNFMKQRSDLMKEIEEFVKL